MYEADFIKAQVALFCWREASQYGGDQCMTAVAFALRNRVEAGWGGGTNDWLGVLSLASKTSFRLEQPLRDQYPDERDPAWRKFFARIDTIVDGTAPDTYTSVEKMWGPAGSKVTGLYWYAMNEIDNPWFTEYIIQKPDQHQKMATVGPMLFYT